jgi:hypothetical protein
MKTKFQILLLLSIGFFISCGGNTEPKADADAQEQTDENATEQDSTANAVEDKEEDENVEEPKSVRLDDDLSLNERFLEVIEVKGESVVWVASDEYQSVFEFSEEDHRFKGYFKKGPNKFEGDWKIEGDLFSLKMDGDDAWNPIPLTVVDRETIVMMNLEFKAE